MNRYKIIALAICVILTAVGPGCGLFAPASEDGQRDYEPPTDPMPVFESATLKRPYKVIGVVTAKGGSFKRAQSALYKLQSQAREMGGEALLDFRRGGAEAQAAPDGERPPSSSAYHLYSAKVIVFTD